MRKNKGFTLIELLAVIVILAIIALIAVPVILNVIEKSKGSASEQSAIGYIDAVEKQIVTNKVKNENLIDEGEYTKSQLDEKNVKIKGEITDALVVVGAKGRVTQARFCINGYSIDYDGKKATKNTEANYCEEIKSILHPCPYEDNQAFNFEYTGNVQTFTAQCDGKYKLEVWGAEGGYRSNTSYSGKGGYATGVVTLDKNKVLYVYSGGSGNSVNSTDSTGYYPGGFNGGGYRYGYKGGGGASDIRIGEDSLLARVIVAGGGGSDGASSYKGGDAGGLTGTRGYFGCGSYGYGGTQNTSSQDMSYINTQGKSNSASDCAAGFGFGGFGVYRSNGYGGAGGGGWYGGEGAYPDGSGDDDGGGGGGSSYVYTESTASNYPSGCLLNSTYYLASSQIIDGSSSMTSPSGSNETGHTGNGYARITYLGEE